MSVRRVRRRDPTMGTVRDFYMIDVQFNMPDGSLTPRVRKVSPVQSRRGAEQYEREVRASLMAGRWGKKEVKLAPTLAEFRERFIEGYCVANRHKPSGMESKESAFRVHILPLLGNRRLDLITNEDVARLKSKMANKEPATTNNALSTLSVMLKTAVEWGVITHMPCSIRLLKRQKPAPKFYDFEQYAWLVDAAKKSISSP